MTALEQPDTGHGEDGTLTLMEALEQSVARARTDRDFHRPGLEPAGVGDEWDDDAPPPVTRPFEPPPDLRCPHGRNFCALCDGEGAS